MKQGVDQHRHSHGRTKVHAESRRFYHGFAVLFYCTTQSKPCIAVRRLLTPDHGFPCRLIIPGHIGGRMVKWLEVRSSNRTRRLSPLPCKRSSRMLWHCLLYLAPKLNDAVVRFTGDHGDRGGVAELLPLPRQPGAAVARGRRPGHQRRCGQSVTWLEAARTGRPLLDTMVLGIAASMY